MTPLAGSRVLVTGADGFIGSHLVERLVHEGADVTALCVYNSNGSAGWLEPEHCELAGRFRTVLGDIRDSDFMRAVVDGHDVVMHLAALIAIPHSYAAPRSYFDTNVLGTLNILEAARAARVTRIVNTSTSEVYGTPASVPIRESHALQGQSPYAASKIGADMVAESFARSFDLPVVTLRPFNTYGPRQSARAVIPTVLGQLLDGVAELRLGNLEPRRDFTYVADTVDGFVRMAEADLLPGSVVQLGTGKAVSIAEVVDICMQVVGHRAEVVVESERVRPDRSEVQVLQSDPSLAEQVLGWSATTALSDGLAALADWLKANRAAIKRQGYQT